MRAPKRIGILVMLLFVWLGFARAQADEVQGVTKSALVVGSIQDLSGPMASFGRQLRNGLLMRVNEVNRQGGVNGRQLQLVVKDSGNDPERVVALANDLVKHDRVFAILGQIGAAQNIAALPVELAGSVINFLPVTGASEMVEPPSPLKVAFWPPYADQARTGMHYLAQHKGVRRPCIVFGDDEFGTEVARGTLNGALGVHFALEERIVLGSGAPDMSAVAQKLKGAACEMVVLGVANQEALALIDETHRLGIDCDFLGMSAIYGALRDGSGDHSKDGLYAVHTVSQPSMDDPSKLVRDWVGAYTSEFQENPAVMSVYGYYIMDLFIKAAARAGPTLTLERFETVLEATIFPRDMFGSPEFHVTATDRMGSHQIRLSEMVNGHWLPVTTLLDTAASAR